MFADNMTFGETTMNKREGAVAHAAPLSRVRA